jgi:hypothetical protein
MRMRALKFKPSSGILNLDDEDNDEQAVCNWMVLFLQLMHNSDIRNIVFMCQLSLEEVIALDCASKIVQKLNNRSTKAVCKKLM